MASREKRGRGALEARVAALEAELAELRRRLELGAGARRAAPVRAPAPKDDRPRCPGCRLPVIEPAERCVHCRLPFAVLPPRLRPFPPPQKKASSARAGGRTVASGGRTRRSAAAGSGGRRSRPTGRGGAAR